MGHLHSGPVLQKLLAEAVREHNVLPLTGQCNLACIFCSHSNNPPETEAYSFPALPANLINQYLPYLDPAKKIIIGESATRLREGEPLTHPQLISILEKLRHLFPQTIIQVTTNGSLLNEAFITAFSLLKPFELIISLNSSSAAGRSKLMRDLKPARVLHAVQMLKSYNITFHGSMVAMPHLVGWDDLQNTILFLDREGAETIRFLLPGFTALAAPDLTLDNETWHECYKFLENMGRRVQTPLLAEPPYIVDLNPIVEGVVCASPAGRTGLMAGDKVIAVAGQKPFCRVESYELLYNNKNPQVVIERNGSHININISKAGNETAGAAFAYDLNPEQVRQVCSNLPADQKSLMLVSQPALRRWQIAAEKYAMQNISFETVSSYYFGGSIECAGLLTVSDYQAALDSLTLLDRYSQVLLPAISFDQTGNDMAGKHYLSLNTLGLHLILIP